MSDFDSQLAVRALATEFTTEVADSGGTTINPSKEDGNLLSIKTDVDQLTFASTRLLVDGSGVTQPVSGTLAVTQSTSPWVVSGTVTANAGTGNFTVVQSSGANLHVDIDNFPATTAVTQSTSPWVDNLTQIDGTAVSVNTGNSDAGTQRVVLASDQPVINVNVGGGFSANVQYNTASAVASNASNTQTYSPGSTFQLEEIWASASGQLKVEVQWGTTGSETTHWVGFTSKGNLQSHFSLQNPVAITNTMSVKVIRTNMDNQAMDVYSSIVGH